VNTILRALVVWITLLALPLQGFAAATANHCAPAPSTAHGVHAHAHASAPGKHAVRPQHAEGAGKCASCAACCSCTPMALSFLAVPPVALPSSITVPFEQRLLPSVHLALPERPPRA
jgi:hypothetical protein